MKTVRIDTARFDGFLASVEPSAFSEPPILDELVETVGGRRALVAEISEDRITLFVGAKE